MNLYEKYAILSAQIEEIEEQKELLRKQILQEMIESDKDKEETNLGTFSITRLKKWTYPKRITELEEQFKTEKALTQSTGEATFIEQESLRFTKVKI